MAPVFRGLCTVFTSIVSVNNVTESRYSVVECYKRLSAMSGIRSNWLGGGVPIQHLDPRRTVGYVSEKCVRGFE